MEEKKQKRSYCKDRYYEICGQQFFSRDSIYKEFGFCSSTVKRYMEKMNLGFSEAVEFLVNRKRQGKFNINGMKFNSKKEIADYLRIHPAYLNLLNKKKGLSLEEIVEKYKYRSRLIKSYNRVYHPSKEALYKIDGHEFKNMKDISRFLKISYSKFSSYLYHHAHGDVYETYKHFKEIYIPAFGTDEEKEKK